MRKLYLVLFFNLIVVFSCYHTTNKPQDLIDKNKMIQILTDLYIYKQIYIENFKKHPKYHKINKFILKKYNVTPIQYKNSFNYYYLDNDTMIKIHYKIKNNLNKEIKKLQMKKNK